jgi:hypothetical protein
VDGQHPSRLLGSLIERALAVWQHESQAFCPHSRDAVLAEDPELDEQSSQHSSGSTIGMQPDPWPFKFRHTTASSTSPLTSGGQLRLDVSYLEGRKHLPIVELRAAA